MRKKKARGNKSKLIKAKAKREIACRSNKTMHKKLTIRIRIKKMIKKRK